MVQTPPIFGYDDEYFKNPDIPYTMDELYEIQQKILDLKDSTNLYMDILKWKIKINAREKREIFDILGEAHRLGIIKSLIIPHTFAQFYYYKYDYPEEKMFEWEKRLQEERSARPL